MNCELAVRLIDDYLEDALNQNERQRLEGHLASCLSCADQLRRRSAFERALLQALSDSVQHRSLSPEASQRIVRAAQNTSRQTIWSNYVGLAFRAATAVVTVALVLVGVLFLLESSPVPVGTRPVTLLPVIQLALSELSPDTLSPANRPTLPESDLLIPPPTDQPALYLTSSDLRIEPYNLQPSETFTLTLVVHSELSQPVDTARLDLEVSGPSGRYHFPLAVEGPLPAPGVSVLQITPQILDDPCQKQYLVPATELFEEPGVYTVRVTLFNPVSGSGR